MCELLPWTAGPGAQKNFDPEHPLARDSKGRSLALLLYSCLIQSVSCRPPSHYVSRTHCRSPAVPPARALACMSVMLEGVKRSKVSPRGALNLPAARFLQTGRFDPLFPRAGARRPGSRRRCCLFLQYLIQSCARGGRRIVEDMCYEIQRAEACVD